MACFACFEVTLPLVQSHYSIRTISVCLFSRLMANNENLNPSRFLKFSIEKAETLNQLSCHFTILSYIIAKKCAQWKYLHFLCLGPVVMLLFWISLMYRIEQESRVSESIAASAANLGSRFCLKQCFNLYRNERPHVKWSESGEEFSLGKTKFFPDMLSASSALFSSNRLHKPNRVFSIHFKL